MAQTDGTVLRTGTGSNFKFQDFVPEIWTGRLLANMKGKTVLAEQCTREYEGEIKGFGDTVRIPGVDRVAVAEYNVGSNITWNRSDSNYLQVKVDRAKYWTTTTDDIEKAQSKPEYVNELMNEAAFALAKNTENYLYGRFLAGATASADSFGQVGGSNAAIEQWDISANDATSPPKIYEGLVNLGVKMDDNEAPTEGRFVVLPSFAHGMLLKDSRFVGAGSYASAKAVGKGEIGQVAGFTIYTMPRGYFDATAGSSPYVDGFIDLDTLNSTAVSNLSIGGAGGDDYKAIAGVKGAMAYVEQLAKTEKVRLENQFADGIRGLHVYGSGIIRPQWMFVIGIDDPNVAT